MCFDAMGLRIYRPHNRWCELLDFSPGRSPPILGDNAEISYTLDSRLYYFQTGTSVRFTPKIVRAVVPAREVVRPVALMPNLRRVRW